MFKILSFLLMVLSLPVYASDVFQFKGVVLGVDIQNRGVQGDVVTAYFARAGYVINQETPLPTCLMKKPSRIFAQARAEGMGIISKVVALEATTRSKGGLFSPIFTARVDCNDEVPIVITAIEIDARDKEDILNAFDVIPVND